MSDRKYRQRGYQDENKPRGPKGPAAPRPPKQDRAPGRQLQDAAGPKTPNLMAAHEVCRCARCGNLLSLPIAADSACPKCGVDLHSCVQCVSFDTSARWECTQSDSCPRASRRRTRATTARCSRRAPRSSARPARRRTATPATARPADPATARNRPSTTCSSSESRTRHQQATETPEQRSQASAVDTSRPSGVALAGDRDALRICACARRVRVCGQTRGHDAA